MNDSEKAFQGIHENAETFLTLGGWKKDEKGKWAHPTPIDTSYQGQSYEWLQAIGIQMFMEQVEAFDKLVDEAYPRIMMNAKAQNDKGIAEGQPNLLAQYFSNIVMFLGKDEWDERDIRRTMERFNAEMKANQESFINQAHDLISKILSEKQLPLNEMRAYFIEKLFEHSKQQGWDTAKTDAVMKVYNQKY